MAFFKIVCFKSHCSLDMTTRNYFSTSAFNYKSIWPTDLRFILFRFYNLSQSRKYLLMLALELWSIRGEILVTLLYQHAVKPKPNLIIHSKKHTQKNRYNYFMKRKVVYLNVRILVTDVKFKVQWTFLRCPLIIKLTLILFYVNKLMILLLIWSFCNILHDDIFLKRGFTVWFSGGVSKGQLINYILFTELYVPDQVAMQSVIIWSFIVLAEHN